MPKPSPLPCIAAALITLSFGVLLFTNAQLVSTGVQTGLEICIKLLLPSLFPFLVLSAFLTKSGLGTLLARIVGRPIGAVLGLSAGGVSALLLALLCGFPVGTATATALLRRGELTRAEWERLLPLVNNPGASFLICVVGTGMLGSLRAGVALFCIVWSAALLVGLGERVIAGKPKTDYAVFESHISSANLASELTAAIGGALTTLLPIFSFVIFFSCITTCLTAALNAWQCPPTVSVLLIGLLELTAGTARAVAQLPARSAFCLCAALAGFSGLSFCMQIAAMTEAERPRLFRYVCKRALIGLICALLSLLYLRLSSEPLAPTKSTVAIATVSGWQSTTVQICLFLICFFAALRLLLHQPWGKRRSPSNSKTP